MIFDGPGSCGLGSGGAPGPQTTVTLDLSAAGDGTDGAFLDVPISANDPKPVMTLRVRDVSKSATSFGTEIHLPQMDEFQPVIDLIDVPTDERYRATLRIYGSNRGRQSVRVRITAAHNTTVIDERELTLLGLIVAPEFDAPYNRHPTYFQLDPLTRPVRASGDRVRVTVDVIGENVSPPPQPIWAFITITDNVTQLVSTITPSRYLP